MQYKVYIGWDPRDAEAAEVSRYSLLKHSTLPIQVEFLRLGELKASGLYTRGDDPDAQTEYTYLRYFIPHLMNYKGLAVYCDPGTVWLRDVRELFQEQDERAAVHVVKHQFKPKNETKLGGRPQSQYPKKNWTSVMLWNCGHPDNKNLTADVANTKPPGYLHQVQWATNHNIYSLNVDWNWLVGHYKEPDDGTPKVLHWTEGGPWYSQHRDVLYGCVYAETRDEYRRTLIPPLPVGQYDNIPPDIEQFFDDVLAWRVDPQQQYNQVGADQLHKQLDALNNNAVYAVEAETVEESSDKLEAKGQNYDPFLKSFIMGSGGQITTWDRVPENKTPVIVRGVTKRKVMHACREQGRDFYYIDTGYFGNGRKKTYHRITRNDMQAIGPVINRPRDRLAQTGVGPRKFRPGRNILLAPPSQKLLMIYDIDLNEWLEDTIAKIKLYTDREIIVRNKQARSVRQSSDTMEMALEKDIHCLVTFSSIAAVEAVLLGKPAITLGPNAAHAVCSHDVREIEKPHIPTLEEVEEWAAHLAYCQFTEPEMRDGTAWRILNEKNDT